MPVGIEFDALRLQFLHPMPRETGDKIALGQFEPFDERCRCAAAALAQLRRHIIDDAPQIVGESQHVPGKGGDAIELRIGDLLLRPPPQILHVGEGAQNLVFQIRIFLLQLLQDDEGIGLAVLRRRRAGFGLRVDTIALIEFWIGHAWTRCCK